MVDESKVKCQMAVCPQCGHSWRSAATETTFDRKTSREFAKMMEQGFLIKSATLQEARATEMYCECEIWNKFKK